MGLLDTIFASSPEDPRYAANMALFTGLMRGDAAGGFEKSAGLLAAAPDVQLRRGLLAAQLEETKAQAQERAARIKAAERAEAVRAQIPGLFGQPGWTGGAPVPQQVGGVPMFSQPLGVTPMQPTPGGFDVRRALELGMDPEVISKYAGLMNLGRPKVARTVKGIGADGKEYEYQVDEYGQKVGDGLAQYRAPLHVNRGATDDFLDPYSLERKASLPRSQSPESVASNALGWANHGLSKQRMAFDQSQAGPKPQFHDGQWVMPPSATNPQGTAVPVPGFAKQLGEGAKKQVAGIDALGGAIDEYVGELGNFGLSGLMRPDKRAAMGTKYNNMMLQAKEAYNLGVLNGPDYAILTSIVTDPISAKGAITSNEALEKQATELKRIMGKVRSAVTGLNANGSSGASAAAPPSAEPVGKQVQWRYVDGKLVKVQ